MNEEIKFVTLYPKCHNPGLMKDVGQIPNTLGINNNVNAKLVSCIVDLNDDNIEVIKGMKIEKIPYILKNDFLAGLVYIWKNADKVDWFNFYHGGRKVYYWTKLYKYLNPNGKVYLKMDLSYEGCKIYSTNKKELGIFERTAKAVDIISVESEIIKNQVEKFSDVEISLISNGYFDDSNIVINGIKKRKKEFITVGRLGTPPKATDILLQAFYKSSDKHDWNLRLVGPVDDSFVTYRDEFYSMHPDMKERVFFEGPVYDKNKLYAMYNGARVFVLPSRWEGFPLVGPEAAHCGCRMILTDIIPPFKELTNNGRYGVSIKTESEDELIRAIINETRREEKDAEPIEISNYAKKELSWKEICNKLYRIMLKKEQNGCD